MRARALDRGRFEGALRGVHDSLVGIGERLERPPDTLAEAVLATAGQHGDKAARMLVRFAELPDSTAVWTQTTPETFRLGRVSGPWRYDDSPPAERTGIHHVRPVDWLAEEFDPGTAPPGVVNSFARGGRNFQGIGDPEARQLTARLLF